MYFDRCLRIHDFRKPTIAAVQGSCVAAGLMLAAMCDLIVAADDAVFSNPVLRLTGAGVELLVEPWELGIRKAKEFLLTGDTIDAQEAWRLGLVNRVVPRAELEARTRELADRVALVPPVTAQTVKDTINQTGTLMGKRDALEVPLHGAPLGAQHGDRARRAGRPQGQGLHARGHRRARRGPRRRTHERRGAGPLGRHPGDRRRHPDLRAVLRRAARRARRRRDQGRAAGRGRLHAHHRPVRARWRTDPTTRCSGRSRAGAGAGVTCDLRKPEGKELFKRLVATADVLCENFRPGTMERWGLGPDDLPDELVYVRISVFGQTGPYAPRPGLDRLGIAFGGLLHLTGDPDRPPVRPGVTVSDYLTGAFAAFAAVAALYGRDHGAGTGGDVIDAPLYGSILRILEWTLAGYDRLGHRAPARGQPALHLGPARQLPDRRRVLRLHRGGLRRQLLPALRGHGPARPDRATRASPRWPSGPRDGDEINGIVADVDVGPDRRGDHGALRRARRAGRHRLQRRRHLRRPAHGRPRRPRGGRRPGHRRRCASRRRSPACAATRPPSPRAPRVSVEHNREVWCDLVGLSDDELADLAARGVV